MKPNIEIVPLKSHLPEGLPCDMDVLIRIHAPVRPVGPETRLPLNLALVLDRSGSMSGRPIEYARQAARVAVQQMKDGDRVSVVAFDDQVSIPVESTVLTASNRNQIMGLIDSIETRGSTDLHSGWLNGGLQVSSFLNPAHLNRVILLSDGEANHGITQPSEIQQNVSGLADRGVSTSTLGMGDHFNEDLLQGMAESGDGNYHYVSDPRELPTFFEQELLGLKHTFGRKVSLGLEPNGRYGIKIKEVFNPFQRISTGRLKLPNLGYGKTIDVVIRLHVPALTRKDLDSAEAGLFRVRLACDTSNERMVLRQQCNLPLLDPIQYAALPTHPLTLEKQAQLEVARDKDEAMEHLDRGDYASSRAALERARGKIGIAMSAPMVAREEAEIQSVLDHMDQGNVQRARKESKYQNYRKRTSKE
ncbi:vWA domain-containing protein [Deinococcus misasensis]|uniref:vWA domain-containing protein n=1 Tax=Deinococcus misasensis TaxID=392413 RepID=UPI00054DCA72|nr:VWA domain-containing protein [Deinococcus misasensis]